MTTLLDLPQDLLLNMRSLCRCACTCVTLNVAAQDDALWKKHAEQRWARRLETDADGRALLRAAHDQPQAIEQLRLNLISVCEQCTALVDEFPPPTVFVPTTEIGDFMLLLELELDGKLVLAEMIPCAPGMGAKWQLCAEFESCEQPTSAFPVARPRCVAHGLRVSDDAANAAGDDGRTWEQYFRDRLCARLSVRHGPSALVLLGRDKSTRVNFWGVNSLGHRVEPGEPSLDFHFEFPATRLPPYMCQAVSRGLRVWTQNEWHVAMCQKETDARMAGIGVSVCVCLSDLAASAADVPAWSCTTIGMSWDPIVLSAVAGEENQFSYNGNDWHYDMALGAPTNDDDARLADDAVLCMLEQAIALRDAYS